MDELAKFERVYELSKGANFIGHSIIIHRSGLTQSYKGVKIYSVKIGTIGKLETFWILIDTNGEFYNFVDLKCIWYLWEPFLDHETLIIQSLND